MHARRQQIYRSLQREGSRPFRISADIGARTPIPWTASGRLLLGSLSDQEIFDLVPPENFAMPDGHRLDTETYLTQIRRAHLERVFSFDSIVDTFTHCFAAPVYDRKGTCIAPVCIVALKADAVENYDNYRTTLIEAGLKLSQFLP
ncbi:hypothetical protein SAMN05216224_101408 [Thioclava dalianensis]|uniref:IclR family transcriptional regulator domain-containing protein n=1 Tax=Thioclava dalianensis TaxID=1185766 RepID=UPI00068AB9AA|nr:hypothetical protein [Thioclava dalianensis]SFM81000.1 hypothetical protein SAMN05216224_101408 [Thioclava dalianensis]